MNSTKPKLNVKLLRRIQKHILEEPRRFFMEGVVQEGEPGKRFANPWGFKDLPHIAPPCGTAACFHGWTGLLSGKTARQVKKLSFAWSKRKLGLSGNVQRLFIDADWPQPFAERYNNASTPMQRAKVAAARIEHLINTGE